MVGRMLQTASRLTIISASVVLFGAVLLDHDRLRAFVFDLLPHPDRAHGLVRRPAHGPGDQRALSVCLAGCRPDVGSRVQLALDSRSGTPWFDWGFSSSSRSFSRACGRTCGWRRVWRGSTASRASGPAARSGSRPQRSWGWQLETEGRSSSFTSISMTSRRSTIPEGTPRVIARSRRSPSDRRRTGIAARISHQLYAAAGDASHPAVLSARCSTYCEYVSAPLESKTPLGTAPRRPRDETR